MNYPEIEKVIGREILQLLRIVEELGDAAVYPGMKAFNVKK